VATGSPGVCLEWSTGRALAAGAAEDEIANALLAIVQVAGLGRVVAAAPDVATALGYDITAALEEPDSHRCSAAGHVDVPADRRMSNPAPLGVNCPQRVASESGAATRKGGRHGDR
jgi:hypothetical protein